MGNCLVIFMPGYEKYQFRAGKERRLYMNPLYKLFRLSGKLDRLKNHILPSRGMFFL